MTFYVYVHGRPDATDHSGVFYVGKGCGNRSFVLPHRNRFHGFVVEKHGAKNIKVERILCESEAKAFELEMSLIEHLRGKGVLLTNMTDGGEGSTGYVMPDEVKAKIAAASREVAKRPGVAEARRKATLALNEERWADPEYRARTAEAMRGKTKTRSTASDEARRANGKKANTPEANALKAAAAKARWADPEFKARMAEKKRLSWQDPEKRAAMLKGRSEGISKSWKNAETRNSRIRGIKYSANTSKEEEK